MDETANSDMQMKVGWWELGGRSGLDNRVHPTRNVLGLIHRRFISREATWRGILIGIEYQATLNGGWQIGIHCATDWTFYNLFIPLT
jgi:hypothetical protein